MNKLKAFSSKITSSTPGGKLSKAFKFDKDLNVLKRNEGARGIGSGGDPFHDGPVLEEVSVPRPSYNGRMGQASPAGKFEFRLGPTTKVQDRERVELFFSFRYEEMRSSVCLDY